MTQLIDANLSNLRRFADEQDIDYLAVFGSHSRGEAHAKSDVDLLVRFKGRKSLLDVVRIERQLSEMLDQRVDLVTEKSLSRYIKPYVEKELKVIYGQR